MNYQHVYLSPHFDDIALSCGGAISQQRRDGETVLAITLCAAAPAGGELSDFAESYHQNWGNPGDVVTVRQAEDRTAMGILDIDYNHLSLMDCIYRGDPQQGLWYYNSSRDIFDTVHPADWNLVSDIVGFINEKAWDKPGPLIYAPLTVGHHVDHQLAHAAAWQLLAEGYRTVFYEDYPYVDPGYPLTGKEKEDHFGLDDALATPRNSALRAELCPLEEQDLKTKVESIHAYASQLSSLFGSQTAMEGFVRRYADYVGGGKPAERIWRPD